MVFDVFAAPKKSKKQTPTKIKSDIIDINRKTQKIQFLHNVIVEKDGSTMLTEKMVVIYTEQKLPDEKKTSAETTEIVGDSRSEVAKSTKTSSSVEKIVAEDKVKIFTEDSVVTADGGYYNPNDETFVLEENVIVNNGTSIANGDKFIYDLTTKKGRFIGEKKQDKAVEKESGDKRVIIIINEGAVKDAKDSKKSKNNQDGKNSQH